MEKNRCSWAKHPLEIQYHDEEWGVPVHDDPKHFEFLLLDTFQAGLSWLTILKKRENFRKAFDNFDFNLISGYDESKVQELLQDIGIVRNKLKISAAINNAQVFLDLRTEYGSFDKYIWSFVNGKTIQNRWESIENVPVTTAESDAMSKDMKEKGFRFVGSTTCYAYMQAAGLVNDHLVECFRYNTSGK
ncbi:MAG: DNA-3-methyladenine glycosylase I [Bacteroidales bacterium]|nr:DNA-3-methyladenine glycosylase I [Bacteroidales bacterium]